MEKLIVGGKFKLFRYMSMNLSGKHHSIGQKEFVGRNIEGLIRSLLR